MDGIFFAHLSTIICKKKTICQNLTSLHINSMTIDCQQQFCSAISSLKFGGKENHGGGREKGITLCLHAGQFYLKLILPEEMCLIRRHQNNALSILEWKPRGEFGYDAILNKLFVAEFGANLPYVVKKLFKI